MSSDESASNDLFDCLTPTCKLMTLGCGVNQRKNLEKNISNRTAASIGLKRLYKFQTLFFFFLGLTFLNGVFEKKNNMKNEKQKFRFNYRLF